MSAPPAMSPAAAAQPRQPGLIAQMASTAAGVAVGSAVGHTMGAAVTGMFSGNGDSSSQNAQQQQQQQPTSMQPAAYDQTFATQRTNNCDVDAKAFTRCLESTNNDMDACRYYLDALKSCQAFMNSQSL
ncbi:hypothetical protein GGI26_003200 [Coemansia sp. RSA 1358]|nr:hypothetical protein BX070DRAFT_253295 [Coemansia spiralis]KAJ1993231.1 hypothetical protein EDC05_002307 [Coemansia umbellata]KAJ2622473.1 hypothetical protein GGI26_003200 [Coemansia sp. RSA 1358]